MQRITNDLRVSQIDKRHCKENDTDQSKCMPVLECPMVIPPTMSLRIKTIYQSVGSECTRDLQTVQDNAYMYFKYKRHRKSRVRGSS